MNLTEVITELAVVQALFNVAFLAFIVTLFRRVERLREALVRMTAEIPIVPTEPEIIDEWEKRFNELDPDTPKHRAYKARLQEVGRLPIE